MPARPLLLAAVIVFCALTAGCTEPRGDKADKTGPASPGAERKIKVYTTIYPLYDFAVNVGKDRVDIVNLVPAGAEPHEWEPSPKDLAGLSRADVFIFCGAGLENWVGRALSSVRAKNMTVVDAGRNIRLIHGGGHEPTPEEEAGGGPEAGRGAVTDPHIWVDPVNAKQMVGNIAEGLAEADPAHADEYRKNAAAYQDRLDALHARYQSELAGVKFREFITSHDAFGYLAERYQLVQIPIRGLSPESEPTPARMAEVVRIAREKGIKYIFFESLVSPRVSEVIAGEAGASTLVLNDAAGLTPEEIKSGKDYIAVMEENLENLKKALGASK
ncbi:MAG: metal ABC transporter substrate-binding protein [Peptococcaceae bacterium]|nr:metal ABC transporter substrate-binding protein [Peptococcaceae bacterium]